VAGVRQPVRGRLGKKALADRQASRKSVAIKHGRALEGKPAAAGNGRKIAGFW
jgi:hypothetical protein